MVDIFVLIYNEDFNVVKNIIYVLFGIDWLKDKLNIWIFDDGGCELFCYFVWYVGVYYIVCVMYEYVKVGNINNVLKYVKGEFVVIFDCDYVLICLFL